jgi:two-component system, sensor histidine kinase YesM
MRLVLRSIRSELLVAFLVLTAAPATVTHFYYSGRVARLVETDAIRSAETSAGRAAAEVARIAGQVHAAELSVAGFLVSASPIPHAGTPDLLEVYQQRQRVWQHFHNLKWVYPFIMGIHVTHWDGTYYSSLSTSELSLDALLNTSWHAQVLEQPRVPLLVPPHDAPYAIYQQMPQRVVSFVRCYNFDGAAGHETVLQIDIDASVLEKALASADHAEGGRVGLVDGAGRVFAASRTEGPASAPAVGRIEVTAEAGTDGLRVVASYPSSLLLRQARIGRNVALLVAFLMMVVALAISLVLSARIARPIRDMTAVMERVGRGDFRVRVPDHPNRDIHILTRSFNRMVDEVNALMKEVVAKETQATRAELGALQAYINPHFLYNTLDVIRGIALANRDPQVVDMVEALANMFRYSSASEELTVPVSRELAHVRNYVSIQRYRHGDRYTVTYSVPDDLLACPVPRLVLQPLVENAFQHGFRGLRRRGMVAIAGERRDGTVVLSVRDDGRGIEPERLAAIESSLATGGETTACGIGIANVHRRVRLACGPGHGLVLRSGPDAGTTAEIVLPGTAS